MSGSSDMITTAYCVCVSHIARRRFFSVSAMRAGWESQMMIVLPFSMAPVIRTA